MHTAQPASECFTLVLATECLGRCIKPINGGGLAHWLALQNMDHWVPGSRPGRVAVCCGLEQVTFTPCLLQEALDIQLTWTDYDKAGDYFVPCVKSRS